MGRACRPPAAASSASRSAIRPSRTSTSRCSGTDPPAQGRGIGSALLAPGLELCDRDGLPAYLESSKERNVAFYSRFGFRVTDEVQMPGGGPKVWLMWRDPS